MSLSSKHSACLSTKHGACPWLPPSMATVCPSRAASKQGVSVLQAGCLSIQSGSNVSCAPIPPLLHPHPPAPSQSLPALGQIHCPGTTRSTFLPPAQKLSSCCTSHQHSLMPEGNSPEIQSCTPSTEAANTTPQCKLIEVPSDFVHKTGETSESHALGRTERLAKHMLK